MIKFFRKIRQSLIKENKVSKYLLYAVGEIVLVVIGILIALSINNWNDKRNTDLEQSKLRYELINAVYADVLSESMKISNLINKLIMQKEAALLILKSLDSRNNAQLDYATLWISIVHELTPTVVLERKRNTWDRLITSDKLEILNNEELSQLLSGYYDRFDYLTLHFKQLPFKSREALREIVGGSKIPWSEIENMSTEMNLMPYSIKFNKGLIEIINEKEFPKIIVRIAVSSANFYYWLLELKTQSQSIIDYMEDNHADILMQE